MQANVLVLGHDAAGLEIARDIEVLRQVARRGHQPPAQNKTQDLYVSAELKTGRVMVKDEDVCLHCGLCAERCPTGAWDMQKFLLDMTLAGPQCLSR